MFFTGYSRAADEVLADQQQRSLAGDAAMLDNLAPTPRTSGCRSRTALEAGDARLRRPHARALGGQAQRSAAMSNRDIDRLYDARARQRRAAAASSSAPAPAASSCSTPTTRVGSARPWPRAGLDRGPLRLRPRRLAPCSSGTEPRAVRDPGRRPRHPDVAAWPSRCPRRCCPWPAGPSPTGSSSWLAAAGCRPTSSTASATSASQVRDFVGDGRPWGLALAYVDEGTELRGTGGALRRPRDQGCSTSVPGLYGDSWLDVDRARCARPPGAAARPTLMTVLRNDDRWDRSNVVYGDGLVVRYDKGLADPPAGMRWIDYGLPALRRELLIGEVRRGRRPGRAADRLAAGRAGRLPGRRPLLRDRLARRARGPGTSSASRRPGGARARGRALRVASSHGHRQGHRHPRRQAGAVVAADRSAHRAHPAPMAARGPGTRYSHELIVPMNSTYSPWHDDTSSGSYDAIAGHTFVDQYKCYELWEQLGQLATFPATSWRSACGGAGPAC